MVDEEGTHPVAAVVGYTNAGKSTLLQAVGLLEGGFQFTGQNPTISIAVSLNRNRRFRKVAPGTFDLTIRDAAQALLERWPTHVSPLLDRWLRHGQQYGQV